MRLLSAAGNTIRAAWDQGIFMLKLWWNKK